MAKVKICGVTNLEDALLIEEIGADFIGFIFFSQSPRFIEPEAVKKITAELKGSAFKVGLFLDQDIRFVRDHARNCSLDIVQLHGNENPAYVEELARPAGGKKEFAIIKSFKIKPGFDFGILEKYACSDFYLFDTFHEKMPGGTGVAFDWKMLKGIKFDKDIFLAGGLNPGNVKKAIEVVRPFAVDAASGVESEPGKKDMKKVEEFINAAQ